MTTAADTRGLSKSFAYTGFGSTFLRVFFIFFAGGILLAFIIEALLLSVALLFDLAGYPSRASRGAAVILAAPALVFFAPIVYLASQFLSAVLVSLFLIVVGRLPIWWVVATAPFVAGVYGYSIFAESMWGSIGPRRLEIATNKYMVVTAIQLLVSLCCWRWARTAAISFTASARSPESENSSP